MCLQRWNQIALAAPGACPFPAVFRHSLSCIFAALNATELALGICIHEASNRHKRRPHTPRWLPCLLMVTRDAQTDLTIDLEAAGRCEETEVRRS